MGNNNMPRIGFNVPYMTGKELFHIAEAHFLKKLSGDGQFTEKCSRWLKKTTGCKKALLTHSCTAALEMAALLLDIKPGDEIIMPSYTFVSTATAFVLRGGVPVFVDIREDTLNINEVLIEQAITQKTKAIVVVHYAGVGCNMDAILKIANTYGLPVIEDSAQGILSTYKNRPLGSIGTMAALSFHETKNVICGEGGAILINDERYIRRAEIIREKGTNRKAFLNGEVDKYTWVDIGSSFLPGEMTAAFLWGQMEEAEDIKKKRLHSWDIYHDSLKSLEDRNILRRPVIPKECVHNAHMYYVILSPQLNRKSILDFLKSKGIGAIFHYVPLHNSPAGKRFGRIAGSMRVTEDLSSRLIRLPLWTGISEKKQDIVISALKGLTLKD